MTQQGEVLVYRGTQRPPRRWIRGIVASVVLLSTMAMGASIQREIDARRWESDALLARQTLDRASVSEREKREALTILVRDVRATVAAIKSLRSDPEIAVQVERLLEVVRDEAR